jgi:release factor glutamine methyltransferase
MLTYRDLLDESAHRIELRDAQGLLAHVSGRDRTWLFAHPEAPAEQATAARFRDLCTRRAAGEPLQYLTGVQEFYGLALRVTPDVLIPRPETEHLVEAVELWATQLESGELLQMADVGTGSGAIAIALATHVGHVRLTAIDHSAAALAIARENAQAHSCADRITFLENDLLSGIPAHSFDAVVSNPPYIPSGDAATLQREVVAHEPHTALFVEAARAACAGIRVRSARRARRAACRMDRRSLPRRLRRHPACRPGKALAEDQRLDPDSCDHPDVQPVRREQRHPKRKR